MTPTLGYTCKSSITFGNTGEMFYISLINITRRQYERERERERERECECECECECERSNVN